MKKNNLQSGFTLIEIMVATSIFVIVVLIAMGSIIVSSDAAKKSQKLRFAMDNINFAMENMSRSIRMGTNYYCENSPGAFDIKTSINETSVKNCGAMTGDPAGTLVAFVPPGGGVVPGVPGRISYQLAQITKPDGTNVYTINRCESGTGACVPIVSPDVNITVLKFVVKGTDPTDFIQPSVYIILKGEVDIKGQKQSFAIQTMASQRTIE